MEEVIAGRVPPCRIRFPFSSVSFYHYIFVYHEGYEYTTSLRYDEYTFHSELIVDIHVTSEGLWFDVVNRTECSSGPPTRKVCWNDGDDDDSKDEIPSGKMWLGVYTYENG
eukprot:PhF_6_TR3747/c0_g3_i2/m.5406